MDDRIVEILERIDRRLAETPAIVTRLDERVANIERQLERFGEFVLELSPSEVREDVKTVEEVLKGMGETTGKKDHSRRRKSGAPKKSKQQSFN